MFFKDSMDIQKDIYGGDVIQTAKPFLKWAGGKKQLLNQLEKRLPLEIKNSRKIDRYVEPFVGGGALFFYLSSNYKIKKAFLFDFNRELILTYNVVKKDPQKLINHLNEFQEIFISGDKYFRKEYYLSIRQKFNDQLEYFDFNKYSKESILRAAYTIFMNKTCFNGLFRLNSKGEFNVPVGRYKNPKICDAKNIYNVSKVLSNVNIYNSDFELSEEVIDNKSFVYLDPPYRPLGNSSNFTNYAGNSFTDEDQVRLADYFKKISNKGAKVMLSNSDPKNTDINDNFFDDLYSEFKIDRIQAKRNINSKGSKRGPISELIIYNNYKI